MIQVFYGCHMMLVENIEQGGVDPGPSAATQALASTLVDALSERNYKVFFPSEKTPDPVRNRRVFAPETMQIEAVNLRCWNVCSTLIIAIITLLKTKMFSSKYVICQLLSFSFSVL